MSKSPRKKAPATTAADPPTTAPEQDAAAHPAPSADQVFAGQTVVLTGTLLTMKRDEAQRLLSAAGAKIGDGVTKQTTLLIYGDKAGSKLAAARKLAIPLMTEAEMVAQLARSNAAPSALGAAAQKIADAAAEEQRRMSGVRADIDAANAGYLSKYGMTLPQLLSRYLLLFSKRPDVYVTNNHQGRPASADTLLRLHKQVPAEWLAVHAEIGVLHFSWVFAANKADRHNYSEGYAGGRICLVDPERFRWWPPQEWQLDRHDFKEDALFDNFVAEGLTKLSYGKKESRTRATLIFDNANDCERHPLGGIFDYLTKGARAGFTWYWQMAASSWEGAEFTSKLYEGSLPRDTPAETVCALLQGQGLSAAEARGMQLWLGDAAVILLHQSLTPEGAERQRLAERFPGANRTSSRSMDLDLIERLTSVGGAIAEAEWQGMLAEHGQFLASGGAGGHWTLLQVAGIPLCMYQGASGTQGKQLALRLKSIKGRSAKGANLSYADLSGSCCDGVNFSGADVSGSVLTDASLVGAKFKGARLHRADFSGSRLHNANFQGADLTGADFECADLTGADFTKAILTDAKFPGALMKDVKG